MFTTLATLDPLLSIDYSYVTLGNITALIYRGNNQTETRVYG